MTHTANLDITASEAFGPTPWAHRVGIHPSAEVVWVDEDDSVEEFLSEQPSHPLVPCQAAEVVAPRLADRLLAARQARAAQANADLPFVQRRWTIRISRTSWAVLLVAAAVSLELLYLGGRFAGDHWRVYASTTEALPLPTLRSHVVGSAEPLAAVAVPNAFRETVAEPSVATREVVRSAPAAPATEALPQAGASMGWATIDVPIQVHVFERGRFVGTNASEQLKLAPGVHELELVNDSVHFRATHEVSIQAGKGTLIQVPLPSGTLSVNALPWGEVAIGDRVIGQTPIGRVPLSIGPHRIVFRHPELGEQTRTVVVAAGTETRLTVDLRQ